MLKTSCAILMTLAATSAWADPQGHESSGGGADDYQVVPAFFRSYDDKPVKACIETAAGFGVDEKLLSQLVRNAFQEWADYIPLKRLNITSSDHVILQKLDLREKCQGDENLRVLFGVETEEVAKYQSQFSRPFGFAQLTRMGGQGFPSPENEGQGFIWIAPPGSINPATGAPAWNSLNREALYGLLLHEMGHVFGCGHVDGTIMSAKLSEYLKDDTSLAATPKHQALYSKIDSQVELIPCLECQATYHAKETFQEIDDPDSPESDWVRTFKLLVGVEPVAPLSLRFEKTGSPKGAGYLVLMDALGKHEFAIVPKTEYGYYQDSTPLFAEHGGQIHYSFVGNYGGAVQPKVGPAIPFVIRFNMGGTKVEIIPANEDTMYPRPLFVAAP